MKKLFTFVFVLLLLAGCKEITTIPVTVYDTTSVCIIDTTVVFETIFVKDTFIVTILDTIYTAVALDSPYTNPVPIDSFYYVYSYMITFKVQPLDTLVSGGKKIGIKWDHNIEPDLFHYNVYLRMGSGVWASNIDVDTTYIEITLPDTGLYYIHCTATDKSYNESPPSNEVAYRCVR